MKKIGKKSSSIMDGLIAFFPIYFLSDFFPLHPISVRGFLFESKGSGEFEPSLKRVYLYLA